MGSSSSSRADSMVAGTEEAGSHRGAGFAVTPAAVTVAICTRDRGDAVLLPLKAILEGTYADVHVLVVDQSEGLETARALLPFDGCPKITYLRSATRGLSAARNEALSANRSAWLAFTDDDCEPAPDWLEQLMRATRDVTAPAIVFGRFLPDLSLADRGMVPGWTPRKPGKRSNPRRDYCLGGFGGNMAINAAGITLAGTFNLELGRGGSESACEEGEYAFRLCLRGGDIYELDGPAVLHHGLVEWGRVRGALRDDYGSTGFVLAAYLRNRHWPAVVQFMYCMHTETRHIVHNLRTGRRPIGIRRPYWLLRGACRGLRSGKRIAAQQRITP